MKTSTNSKTAAGCMVLFALPFFAVGVFTTVWSAWTALQHSRMQSWVETPATIKHAELKVTHDDGTTYRVLAVYEYEYAGKRYAGERVAIDKGSDNISRFQQEKYEELKQHLDRNLPFRCFVNPDGPSEAVLYRDLRGEIVVFYTLFATLFGAVGLGLMTAVITAARRMPQLKADVPSDTPWIARADWEAGLIPSGSGTKVAITTLSVVALYWTIAILPLIWKLPEVLVHGHGFWKWSSLAFPLVGAVIVAIAAYLLIRKRKFGESTLLLAGTPGVIGGQLAGVIRVGTNIEPTDGFHLQLNCLDWVQSGDGRSEQAVWQDEQIVTKPMQGDGQGTAIPVLFAIPFSCRETTRPDGSDGIHWRLDASARVPGVDYAARFEVPVYKTAESRPDFKPDEGLLAQITSAPNYDHVLRGESIIKEPLGDGVRLVFRMARQPFAAVLFTIVLAIWFGVVWGIHFVAPIFSAIFGAFGLIILLMTLNFWFYRSVAEATPSGLTIRGGLFGIGRTHVIPTDEIQEFTVTEGMKSGTTVWNNIVVVLRNGKKRTVAQLISSRLAQRAVIDELQTALGLHRNENASSPK